MTHGQILTKRTLLEARGKDTTDFLGGLITCDVEKLAPFDSAFGALLTPQGKILFDFFLIRLNDGYLFDVADCIADEFVKRLTFYRLRKDVEFSVSQTYTQVTALWDKAPQFDLGLLVKDPRHAELGWRFYSDGTAKIHYREGDYDRMRIAIGIPDGGADFSYGEVFPHDTLMDQFGGIDFKKGCFIGQEVVSRMQHRGTARKRIVKLIASGALPDSGTSIVVDNRNVGTLGRSVENCGLALVRLDRVAEAIENEKTIFADGTPVEVQVQDWVNFTLKAGV